MSRGSQGVGPQRVTVLLQPADIETGGEPVSAVAHRFTGRELGDRWCCRQQLLQFQAAQVTQELADTLALARLEQPGAHLLAEHRRHVREDLDSTCYREARKSVE